MSKPDEKNRINEMREEYDFRGGVRGKHAERFKTSEEVNRALRKLADKEAS